VFAGYLIGGAINDRLGWRSTVLVLGVFGLVVAALLFLTVREPVRGIADGQSGVSAASVRETARYLWGKRAYRHFVSGASIAMLGTVGSGVWIISFFVRVHGMTPLQASTWIAFIYGIGGVIGALTGGAVADRLARSSGDARWQGWIPAIAVAAILPFSLFVYLWPNPITALLVHTGTTFLLHAWMGPCYGTVQTIAGPSRRAIASAVNVLVVNLLALGLGPLLVGAMSDYFNAAFGEGALRYSILALVVVTFPWAAVHFLLAARTLRQDLASG
jgi:predicted MFS family arabinose efflux permease